MVGAFGRRMRARPLGDLLLHVRISALGLRREIAIGLALRDERSAAARCLSAFRLEDDLLVVVAQAQPLQPSRIERMDSSVER